MATETRLSTGRKCRDTIARKTKMANDRRIFCITPSCRSSTLEEFYRDSYTPSSFAGIATWWTYPTRSDNSGIDISTPPWQQWVEYIHPTIVRWLSWSCEFTVVRSLSDSDMKLNAASLHRLQTGVRSLAGIAYNFPLLILNPQWKVETPLPRPWNRSSQVKRSIRVKKSTDSIDRIDRFRGLPLPHPSVHLAAPHSVDRRHYQLVNTFHPSLVWLHRQQQEWRVISIIPVI